MTSTSGGNGPNLNKLNAVTNQQKQTAKKSETKSDTTANSATGRSGGKKEIASKDAALAIQALTAGQVNTSKTSKKQLEAMISDALKNGSLKNPAVLAQLQAAPDDFNEVDNAALLAGLGFSHKAIAAFQQAGNQLV